jgi:hypothetical protein
MVRTAGLEPGQLINRLTEETAWPVLRNRLLLMALDNDTDPVATFARHNATAGTRQRS